VRSKKYRLHEITVIEPNTSSKPRPSTPVNPLPIDTRNFDDTPLLEWIPSIDADYYVVIIDSPNIKDENGKRAVLFHSGRVRTNTAQVPANKPLPRTGLRITIKACFDNHSCYITRTNTNIAPIAEAPPVEVSDFTLEDLADGLFELSWTPHHDTMYYSLRVNIPTEKNAVAYNDAYIAVGRNILVGDDGKVHYKLNSRRLASLIRRTGLRHLPIRDAGYYRVRLYSNNSISLQDVSKRPVPARVNIGCGNVHVAYCN
ncbi:MAG: hypothetical protein OXU45_05695, partial [Candidatus Melainabacteria bacterium]|nr:hypothetical protein [Candidatus Melainabacteria bacterium]